MNYKVIDNFLDISEFSDLKNMIVFNPNFSIYLMETVAESDSSKSQNSFIEKKNWNWYGTHIIYNNHEPKSSIYSSVGNYLLEKIQTIEEIKALIRIKINFYPYTKVVEEHAQHRDYLYSHKGAILSLNTCDGFTRMPNGDKIDSVENRIVFFDPVEYHNSSTTSNQKGRYNINFNWI